MPSVHTRKKCSKANPNKGLLHVQYLLGIIIVGIIMTVKVVMDGFQAITHLNDKITALRASTRNCQEQLALQAEENQALEDDLTEVKSEVEALTQKEKEMNTQILTLRTDLDGNKTNT